MTFASIRSGAIALVAAVIAMAASADLRLGEDVLTSAATNYSPQYAACVERLLIALMRDATEVEADQIDAAPRVQLDLLVARSHAPPDAIADGAMLRDGRGDRTAGDRLKVRFSANCDCFVYVIAIDASGRVTAIFPDPDSNAANPVAEDRAYVVPEATTWWSLDERRGIEQIHTLASRQKRADIEEALTALTDAPVRTQRYRAVSQVIALPPSRGIVTVEDARVTSRWFRHE